MDVVCLVCSSWRSSAAGLTIPIPPHLVCFCAASLAYPSVDPRSVGECTCFSGFTGRGCVRSEWVGRKQSPTQAVHLHGCSTRTCDNHHATTPPSFMPFSYCPCRRVPQQLLRQRRVQAAQRDDGHAGGAVQQLGVGCQPNPDVRVRQRVLWRGLQPA